MLIKKIGALKKILKTDLSIGLVPTMGSLHKGHLSLIEKANADNDIVVVSIFVNPTQFAPNEDFDTYPRSLEKDYELSKSAGADYVFAPSVREIYPEHATTYVIVEGPITTKLCGASRPTHFKGVTSVVAMLLNIVNPTKAYFGQKDAQQAIIIEKMVKELHMPIQIVICPIIRESDGLAMSSRNINLTKKERKQAPILHASLENMLKVVADGHTNVDFLINNILETLNTAALAEVEYVSILDAKELTEIKTIENTALAAIAVRFGSTRLIDNVFIEVII